MTSSREAESDFWMQFFASAGIPPNLSNDYVTLFITHRIQPNLLNDLSREILNEMGIVAMGDVIAILKRAKQVSMYAEMPKKNVSKSSDDVIIQKTTSTDEVTMTKKPKREIKLKVMTSSVEKKKNFDDVPEPMMTSPSTSPKVKFIGLDEAVTSSTDDVRMTADDVRHVTRISDNDVIKRVERARLMTSSKPVVRVKTSKAMKAAMTSSLRMDQVDDVIVKSDVNVFGRLGRQKPIMVAKKPKTKVMTSSTRMDETPKSVRSRLGYKKTMTSSAPKITSRLMQNDVIRRKLIGSTLRSDDVIYKPRVTSSAGIFSSKPSNQSKNVFSRLGFK